MQSGVVVQHSAVQCITVQGSAVKGSTVQCLTMHCIAVQYSAKQDSKNLLCKITNFVRNSLRNTSAYTNNLFKLLVWELFGN